jgi:glycosyltransferase involved in cell wall biosynthesis
MRNILINIYYGTVGNAGLYLKRINDELQYIKLDIDIKSFVNYYFSFKGIEYYKIFFKYSQYMKNRLARKFIKYFELIIDYSIIYFKIKRISKKYGKIFINYSLNENYIVTFYFLKALKRIKNVKVGITIHDIIPFYNDYPELIMKKQKYFIKIADYYIVHNSFSSNYLKYYYAINDKKIYLFRFPIMDLKTIYNIYNKNNEEKNDNKIYFVMLGYLRKEKGIDLLIKAWENIQDEFNNAYLIIAGNIPYKQNYQFQKLKNCDIIIKYLSDQEYIELIMKSHYIVLPYKIGTNSGVLSTITSLGKPSITSNIQMFLESGLTIDDLIFINNDYKSLYKVLRDTIIMHNEKYKVLCEKVKYNLKNYNSKFKLEITNEISKLIVDN